mmetsp:Transcript_16559/g.47120  ORF Transcript_16559/g.47120 Transcript_16559/m.47120 type:complete len:222 (+) Transcript_16559:454-1119(+)
MCEINPRRKYSPASASFSAMISSAREARLPPVPPVPPPPWLAASRRLGSSAAWLKSQSAARSRLPLHSFRASCAASCSKPMLHSIDTASGSAAPAPAAPAPLAPAPGAGGSAKSGSSMCSSTHCMACSAPAFWTAIKAFLHPFSLKPIETSCTKSSASGSMLSLAPAPPAAAAGSSPSGSSVSPACKPVPRNLPRSKDRGTGTRHSSFCGTQSSPTMYRLS